MQRVASAGITGADACTPGVRARSSARIMVQNENVLRPRLVLGLCALKHMIELKRPTQAHHLFSYAPSRPDSQPVDVER
ncbi:hypothetical protein EVAR_81599_1 [Eumeta japonica]|uniref:Uncharacterized protein n=1 Tax=Eumeta variegata TaxID=151549 RepID=A0A4C1WF55_EUMVA|nr:hypothetical protein EVAR_81599_1 [Eumeta japonica]